MHFVASKLCYRFYRHPKSARDKGEMCKVRAPNGEIIHDFEPVEDEEVMKQFALENWGSGIYSVRAMGGEIKGSKVVTSFQWSDEQHPPKPVGGEAKEEPDPEPPPAPPPQPTGPPQSAEAAMFGALEKGGMNPMGVIAVMDAMRRSARQAAEDEFELRQARRERDHKRQMEERRLDAQLEREAASQRAQEEAERHRQRIEEMRETHRQQLEQVTAQNQQQMELVSGLAQANTAEEKQGYVDKFVDAVAESITEEHVSTMLGVINRFTQQRGPTNGSKQLSGSEDADRDGGGEQGAYDS